MQPAPDGRVEPDEPGSLNWEGELRDGSGSEDVVVGTTDGCVVFRSEAGRYGAFPREHISSVESRIRTEAKYEGTDYRLLVGGGAVLSTLAFFGAIGTSSALVALVLLLVGVGGLRLADYGWKHREEFDGIDRVETPVEHVTLHSDGGVHRRFVVPIEHRAGARLGEFVRNGDRPRSPSTDGDRPPESTSPGTEPTGDSGASAFDD